MIPDLRKLVYELIYRSQASPGVDKEAVKEILKTARAFNSEHNISGCLLFHENHFLQLLEGEFNVLMELYEKIKKDKRHTKLVLIHMQETKSRTYSDWTMAFKSLKENEMKKHTGLTTFSQFESDNDHFTISKQLFKTLANGLIAD